MKNLMDVARNELLKLFSNMNLSIDNSRGSRLDALISDSLFVLLGSLHISLPHVIYEHGPYKYAALKIQNIVYAGLEKTLIEDVEKNHKLAEEQAQIVIDIVYKEIMQIAMMAIQRTRTLLPDNTIGYNNFDTVFKGLLSNASISEHSYKNAEDHGIGKPYLTSLFQANISAISHKALTEVNADEMSDYFIKYNTLLSANKAEAANMLIDLIWDARQLNQLLEQVHANKKLDLPGIFIDVRLKAINILHDLKPEKVKSFVWALMIFSAKTTDDITFAMEDFNTLFNRYIMHFDKNNPNSHNLNEFERPVTKPDDLHFFEEAIFNSGINLSHRVGAEALAFNKEMHELAIYHAGNTLVEPKEEETPPRSTSSSSGSDSPIKPKRNHKRHSSQ